MENNTTDIQEKIDTLAKDEAFVEAYEKVETPAELVELFHKHGIEVPVEIAQELFDPASLDAELSVEELENVAGGGWGRRVVIRAAALGAAHIIRRLGEIGKEIKPEPIPSLPVKPKWK